MIIRIVKLQFHKEKLPEFFQIFEDSKELIRSFPGCQRLELLEEESEQGIIMTYSWWNSADDLENYRHSELFKSTWAKTKVLFAAKPEAWSMNRREALT